MWLIALLRQIVPTTQACEYCNRNPSMSGMASILVPVVKRKINDVQIRPDTQPETGTRTRQEQADTAIENSGQESCHFGEIVIECLVFST